MCVFVSAELVLKDPAFKRDDRYFLSSEEAFDTAMRKSVKYIDLLKEEGVTNGLNSQFVIW